ncbi:MAG: hypothetical protein ABWY05_11435 [Noviherbaspirillum sp.]
MIFPLTVAALRLGASGFAALQYKSEAQIAAFPSAMSAIRGVNEWLDRLARDAPMNPRYQCSG